MPDDDKADLLRKFESAISGTELADLRQLADHMSLLDGGVPDPAVRPDLRRRRLDDVVTYRIRVDLDHARPPIWRRLDLRSDLTLDVVHQVLQAAFGWADSHLHRFSLGGGPFDSQSQVFLCPYDAEEGVDDGLPADTVRVDETLQVPGDVLRYVYDYGDSWELTLRLEAVLPHEPGTRSATCVAGERAAPPEDCGGITDAADLGGLLEDPAHFDLAEVDHALRTPYFLLRDKGVHPRLVDLLDRLRFTSMGEDVSALIPALVSRTPDPEPEEVDAALQGYQWFLDRARDGGIDLTAAGYLRPADVEAASAVVPTVGAWIGKNNRESHTAPLLDFRHSLQSMGLLRKHKGRLLLTRAGAAAQRDRRRLWTHLAERLVPDGRDRFTEEASLLLLAYVATSPGGTTPLGDVAEALGHLGWSTRSGPLEYYDVYHLEVYTVLRNVSDRPVDFRDRDRIHPVAAALAGAALRRPDA